MIDLSGALLMLGGGAILAMAASVIGSRPAGPAGGVESELGLKRARGWDGTTTFSGTFEGLHVAVGFRKGAASAAEFRIPGVRSSLVITTRLPQGFSLLDAEPNDSGDFTSGDCDFDREVRVQVENRAWARAIFDAGTRDAVRRLLVSGGSVQASVVRWNSVSLELTPTSLRQELSWGCELVRRLSVPGVDVPSRLVHLALHDPVAGVRRRCIMEASPGAVLAALEDPDSGCRLAAALGAGDAGRAVLLACCLDSGLGGPDRVLALRELASTQAGKRMIVENVDAIADRHPTRSVMLRLLPSLGHPEPACVLLRFLGDPDASVAVAAIDGLRELGVATAEKALLATLLHPDPGVVAEACRALGTLGTVGAIPGLRNVALRNAGVECSTAASRAVTSIQSRIAGAEVGQLSLAGAGSGALSEAAGDGVDEPER